MERVAVIAEVSGSDDLSLQFTDIGFKEWLSLHLSGVSIWAIPGNKLQAGTIILPLRLSEQIKELRNSELGNFSLRSDSGESIRVELSAQLVEKIMGTKASITPIGKLGEALDNFVSLSQEHRERLILWYVNLSNLIETLLDTVTFPLYGTLLGTIRNQKLIGHDNDLDLGFVVCGDIVDQYRNMQKLEELLSKYGYRCTKHSNGIMKVTQNVESQKYSADLFPVLITNKGIRVWYEVHTSYNYDLIFPTRAGLLEGIGMKVPNKAEVLLEMIYGKDWIIPNPSFSYDGRRDERSNRYFRSFLPDELAVSKSRIWNKINNEFDSNSAAKLETLTAHQDFANVFFIGCPWDLMVLDEFKETFREANLVACLDISEIALLQFTERLATIDYATTVKTQKSHVGAVNSLFDFLFLQLESKRGDSLISIGSIVSYLSKMEIRNFCWGLEMFTPEVTKILLRPEIYFEGSVPMPNRDAKRRDYFVKRLEVIGFKSERSTHGTLLSRH